MPLGRRQPGPLRSGRNGRKRTVEDALSQVCQIQPTRVSHLTLLAQDVWNKGHVTDAREIQCQQRYRRQPRALTGSLSKYAVDYHR